MKRITAVTLILLVISFSLFAGDSSANALNSKALTLENCYQLALEKNKDFLIAGEDKKAAEAQLSKAAANFGPTVSLMGGYEPVYKAVYLTIPGTGTLPMGTQSYYSARLSLSQPVFTFGKNLFGFRIAEEAYNLSVINYKKAGEKLKLDILTAYYGALISKEMLKAQQEAYRNTEEYLKITKARFDNGQASNLDLLRAKVQLASTLPELQKAEDNARLSMQNLKNAIGESPEAIIELTGNTDTAGLDMTFEQVKDKIKEGTDDKRTFEAMENIAGLQQKLSYAMLLPNFAINANYNYFSTEPAFHRERNRWSSSWDVTLGMQWTLFDSFKNVASIKESDANARKASLNRENMDSMLDIQLDSLFTSIEQNKKVIDAADELIKQAEEGARIASESYKNGLIQATELTDTQIMLMKARINYLNALMNYTVSIQKLKNFIE